MFIKLKINSHFFFPLEKDQEIYVVVDSQLEILVPDYEVAFLTLLASYFVFNRVYPHSIGSTYEFAQMHFLDIVNLEPARCKSDDKKKAFTFLNKINKMMKKQQLDIGNFSYSDDAPIDDENYYEDKSEGNNDDHPIDLGEKGAAEYYASSSDHDTEPEV